MAPSAGLAGYEGILVKAKMVLVEWEDAAVHAGWQSFEPNQVAPPTCYSVGFLLGKTRSAIMLATSIGDGEVGGLLVIPRGCVTAIKRIR